MTKPDNWAEFLQIVMILFPEAIIETKRNGELIINTGIRALDNEELETLDPDELFGG